MEMVTYWHGRPVAELSKDELIAVVGELAAENERLREREAAQSKAHINSVADMVRDFNQIMRPTPPTADKPSKGQ